MGLAIAIQRAKDERASGLRSAPAGRMPTKHPKTTKAMIPGALAAHDRAQEASDAIRVPQGLPKVPENTIIQVWREEMAKKSAKAPKKSPKRASRAKEAKPMRSYCVSPSCPRVAQEGSQYCGAHAAKDQSSGNGSDPLTPDKAFRMSGRELREADSPVAREELARRKAKRAAKKQ